MNIIPIRQWSASKLKTFSQCKLRAQLQYGQKIPEPERPLPPGKTEHANDRGTRIHESAEAFCRGTSPLIPELGKFRTEFESLKTLFNQGMAEFEGEWAMCKNWEPAGWSSPEAWLRLKLDAIVHLNELQAVVIDYKSGRRHGNEIGHAEQTQLYALVSFLRFPMLEEVTTELWYVDGDELTSTTYTRNQALRVKPAFTRKGLEVTECTDFPANPNIFSCAYCPYSGKQGGTGHCEVGYWKNK